MTGNYKHIRFEEIEGFTVCRSNHGGAVLGRVEWMARWKEYEFVPEENTAYTVECLRDLADFVGKMNRKKANASSKTDIATLKKADWNKVEDEVVEKIRLLKAACLHLESNPLNDKIAEDIFLPALALLGDFCTRITLESDEKGKRTP